MNFQQLEYIVSLARLRNFVAAAAACNVSQPTLSAMVKKLEDELNITIIKRGQQPLEFTSEGEQLLLQAKRILVEQKLMFEISKEISKGLAGEIRLGVIPSLALVVIPGLIQKLEDAEPQLKVTILELPTEKALSSLLNGQIDLALLATESDPRQFESLPLFEEEIVAYVSPGEKLPKRKYIQPEHFASQKHWFLSEEHCFREQAMEICTRKTKRESKVRYEAGSAITLVQLVDCNGGITIIPSSSVPFLSATQRANVREFAPPAPKRLIQLVSLKEYPRKRLVEFLGELISL